MTDSELRYRELAIVGTLIIISLAGAGLSYLRAGHIRLLLDENPTAELILATDFTTNRLELIGRSLDPGVEWFKWRFEGIQLKAYRQNDLISTSEWRLFNGTTQVKYREVEDVAYNYTEAEAWIIQKADYFTDSYHTNYVGTVTRTIQIMPNTMKESVELESNETGLRFQYVVDADNLQNGERVDMDEGGATAFVRDYFELNWTADKDKVTSAFKYGNGRIYLNFARDEYKIDPTLKIGSYELEYRHAPTVIGGKDIGREYHASVTGGDLPIAVKLNKDLTIEKSDLVPLLREVTQGKRHTFTNLEVELLRNATYESSRAYNVTECEECLNATNGSYYPCNCKTELKWDNQSGWRWEWGELPDTLHIEGGRWYVINLRGKWKAELGERSDDVLLSVKGYPTSKMEWWNTSWDGKRKVDVEEKMDLDWTRYSIYTPVNIGDASWESVRVVNSTENGELGFGLDAINASYVNVSFKPNLTASSTESVYVYYGNADALAANISWNEAYYALYDTFPGSSFSSDWYGDTGSWSVSGGCAHPPNDWSNIYNSVNFSFPFRVEWTVDTGGSYEKSGVGMLNLHNEGWASYTVWADTSSAGDNKWRLDNSTTNQNVGTRTDNVAGLLIVDFGNDIVEFYKDGVQDGSIPERGDAFTYPGSFLLRGNDVDVGICSPLKVRSYANPAPTVTVGAEETQAVDWLNTNATFPADNAWTSDTIPDFSFYANGSFPSYDCELLINSTGYGTNSSTLNNTLTTITANDTLADDYYTWQVNCSNSTTYDATTSRGLHVDTAQPDWSLDSPSNNTIHGSDFWINWTLTETNRDTELWTNDSYTTNYTWPYSNFSFNASIGSNSLPNGIAYHDGYFWVTDDLDDEVYRYWTNGSYSGFSFDTAGDGVGVIIGITQHNNYFWIVDSNEDEIYRYWVNGTYSGYSFDTAGSGNANPSGITQYDGYFWITDIIDDEIYRYWTNGTYSGYSFDTASSGNADPRGIAQHNGYFWITGITETEVYRYWTNGSYSGFSFDTNSADNAVPVGITQYNGYFWVADQNDAYVYRYWIPYDISVDVSMWGDGIKQVYVWANDTASNSGEDMFNFTIDTTAPTVTIVSPENTTYTTSPITLEYTAVDATTNIHTCQYSLNGTANQTIADCANTTVEVVEGLNDITVWANDSAGHWDSDQVYFTYEAGAWINISLVSPANTSKVANNTTPDFKFYANGSYTGFECELLINETGYGTNSSVFNATLTNITANHSVNLGWNSWYINCSNSTNYNTSDTWYFNASFPAMDIRFSGTWCYQETANVSTACGGLDTGSYDWGGNWSNSTPVGNLYDGDWTTAARSEYGIGGEGMGDAWFYVNYTKPSTLSNQGTILDINRDSYWQVRYFHVDEDDDRRDVNFTIPITCWNQDPLQFKIESNSSTGGISAYYCHDGSDWELLREAESEKVTAPVFEEAMYWHAGCDSLRFDVNLFENEIVNATYQEDGDHCLYLYNNGTEVGLPQCKVDTVPSGLTMQASITYNFQCSAEVCHNLTTSYQQLYTVGPANITISPNSGLALFVREYHIGYTGGTYYPMCEMVTTG